MSNSLLELDSKSLQIVELLCAAARKGLADCYSEIDSFPLGPVSDDRKPRLSMASNLRYMMISQIGIKHHLRLCGSDAPSLPDLWAYICARSHTVRNAGDLALSTWAAVESDADNCCAVAGKLANSWSRLCHACNAVELAWVVQAGVCLSQHLLLAGQMADVLRDAHNRLMSLYRPNTRLFARHNRSGLREFVSSRIACFADQVYPILALANYGSHFNDAESIDAAVAVADTICRLQGPKGQWWWHYDTKSAVVAEEYPVFSVHQDAMAPMALMAIDGVAGTNHGEHVERGLMWLNRYNELSCETVMVEQGMISRDIHRREITKMYRNVRGVLSVAGCNRAHCLAGKNLFGYALNKQCRPYHMGWILYAWAGASRQSAGLSSNASGTLHPEMQPRENK